MHMDCNSFANERLKDASRGKPKNTQKSSVDEILTKICWDWCDCSNHAMDEIECESCTSSLNLSLTRKRLRKILTDCLGDKQ